MTAVIADTVFVFGRFTVERDTRRLLIDGVPARLSARAFDLLLALIAQRERMVDKHELLDLVWPGSAVEESNIYVHVSTLRKLLGPEVISTVPGRGYRFIGELETPRAVPGALRPPPAGASPAGAATAATGADEHGAQPAGNIPAALAPLYGRLDHLPTVLALLQNHRLITLVGAGGIGKTRLALATAHIERERWPEGVWMVELAPLCAGAAVATAVAQVLGISLPGRDAAAEELGAALRMRRMLLVLDNAEHLSAAVAALASTLLAQAPRIKLLVTSREPLHLAQEQQYRVPPLSVPEDTRTADLREFGAMALFEARAAAADPRFALVSGNASAIADICRRLDGLPLAIELAAARVPLLGVDGLRSRLDDCFRVLGTSAGTGVARHQTLHATFDWAHDLLTPAEQAVLRRVGIFVGGFTLELAQQVASDPVEAAAPEGAAFLDEWAVLDALGALIDKSLVAADTGEPPRYRLLETTRAYALEKLGAAGEDAPVRQRHALAMWRLFRQTESAKNDDGGTLSTAGLLARLTPEIDNLRAARAWAMATAGQRRLAIGLAASSAEAMRLLGHSGESARVMMALRGDLDDEAERADPHSAALFWNELNFLGKHGRVPSQIMLDASLRAVRLYSEIGRPVRLYRGLFGRGMALRFVGRIEEAAAIEATMRTIERPSWPGRVLGLRLLLETGLLEDRGRYEEAVGVLGRLRALIEMEPGEEESLQMQMALMCFSLLALARDSEALALATEIRQRSRSPRITLYAQIAAVCALAYLERSAEAAQLLREGIGNWQRDRQLLQYLGLPALVALGQGRLADAARLDGAAAAFQARSGVARHAALWRVPQLLERAYAAAGVAPDQLEAWRREGARLSDEALVLLCLGEGAGSA